MRNTNQLQDLDLSCSPHLKEIRFGRNVDLDLLSLFPLNEGKNHGGMERKQTLKRSTMEERESEKRWETIGEEGPLSRLPQKPTVGGRFAGAVLPPGLVVLPPHTFQPTNG